VNGLHSNIDIRNGKDVVKGAKKPKNVCRMRAIKPSYQLLA